MLKWMLAAGAAALAISAPAQADPKGGKGGGNQDHSGHVAKAQKGGGDRGQKADRGKGGGDKQQFRASQPRQQFAQRDDKQRGGGQGKVKSPDRGERGKSAVKFDDRGGDRVKAVRFDDKGRNKGRDDDVRIVSSDRGRDIRAMRVDRDFDGVRFVPRWNERGLAGGFLDGCPPGLAKKGNGCLPPGQAKKIVGSRFNQALGLSALSGPYRDWYRDDDRFMYRWDDDDYVYRIRRDNNLIDALFPMSNRDYYYYPVGMQYPDYYNYYNVPYQYQSFYPDGGDYLYRYGDGAIYMVDPDTQMISGIASLLTGNPLAVGQPLPPYYGVYNVPLGYRDQYYDTADNWYRYNDGYIYRVDPATQLITAVINAIV